VHFPSSPRERIAIASYPFRDFISPSEGGKQIPGWVELKDFAAHVIAKFNINKIEPWTGHFPHDPKYLMQFRAALEEAKAEVVNIAVDGEHSPYAVERIEREKAVAFSKHWVDVAVAIGSPGIRTSIPQAKDSKPNVERTADSLLRVVEYAASKNIVISLENDNPVSEDPFSLVKVIEKVNSPWLHALPDFANTLAHADPDYAYRGIDVLFAHAYNICHVKNGESGDQGKLVEVDLARTFGLLKSHQYKGYCSMEWDRPGDPYRGTALLIEDTVRFLSS